MLTGGQLADQPPALAGTQPRVGCFTDQRVPEQRDGPGASPYFSTRREGTGLGLAIVRQIVTDNHGSVRAAPNVPLRTRIIISLPLSQA